MRVAIAGITHEALGSSPLTARLDDFRVVRGDKLLRAEPHRLDVVGQQLDIDLVPILSATHIAPSGVVELATYLQFRDEILAGLKSAAPLDGVCLLLHGALLVQHIWSGEADLVREIRALLGPDVPIAASFDLHATLTEDFANRADVWTGFRTAPHRDAVETIHRALALLARTLRSGHRPRPVFVRVPLLLQGEKATTDVEPMRSLEAMARAAEQDAAILSADVFVGFGWADSPHSSSSVSVVAADESHLGVARQHACRIAQAMWDRRYEFGFDQEIAATVDDALDLALAAPERSVWLTDSGDNPTAGTPGDSTYFLRRMLERGVSDAVFASIPDAAAWQVCTSARVGQSVSLQLGAHWDNTHSAPLEVNGVVEHVSEDMATARIDGVHVVITRQRKAMTTLSDFRRAGIDPLAHKVVVVKLGYLMPELRDAAPREVLVLTPGYSDMQLERLPWRYVTRPIFPLDRDFSWHPHINNVAAYSD